MSALQWLFISIVMTVIAGGLLGLSAQFVMLSERAFDFAEWSEAGRFFWLFCSIVFGFGATALIADS